MGKSFDQHMNEHFVVFSIYSYLSVHATKCGSGQQAVCILKEILKHEWNVYITLLKKYNSTLETQLFVCPHPPTPLLSDFNKTKQLHWNNNISNDTFNINFSNVVFPMNNFSCLHDTINSTLKTMYQQFVNCNLYHHVVCTRKVMKKKTTQV